MPQRCHRLQAILAALVLVLILPARTRAQTTPDGLGLALVSSGHSKVRLTVTAGASGAPNGFEVCWMSAAQFASLGGIWPPPWIAGEGWVDYIGVGTVNTWGASSVDFRLAPNQSLDVEIGDTFDESGVSGTVAGPLTGASDYVFCAYAVGAPGGSAGPLSVTLDKTTSGEGEHCTASMGYWKNHPSSWPVTGMLLGSVSYSASQLQSILAKPAKGNALITLAHQLITAKLNAANGAVPGSLLASIAAADAIVGNLVVPPVGTDALSASSGCNDITQELDDFNNDEDGHEHCSSTAARRDTWGAIKSAYR